MNLRRLRYFATVADELHFGRAAARLHIAQPALSQQIKTLERELGFALFDRTSRRVQLTVEGGELLAAARALLAAEDTAERLAARLRTTTGTALRLGVVASLPDNLLPALLAALAVHEPALTVRTVGMSTGQQIAALAAGDLQAGLLRQSLTDHPGLHSTALIREPVGVILHADHRLATRDGVDAADLADQTLIHTPDSMMPAFARDLAAALTAANCRPRNRQESPDTETTLALVSAGLGVSFVPRTLLQGRHSARHSLVWKPLTDIAVTSGIYFGVRRHDESPVVTTMRNLLTTIVNARSSPPQGGTESQQQLPLVSPAALEQV